MANATHGARVDTIHAHQQRVPTFLPWLVLGLLAVALLGWALSRRPHNATRAPSQPTTTEPRSVGQPQPPPTR
jgi:hypothetical protein